MPGGIQHNVPWTPVDPTRRSKVLTCRELVGRQGVCRYCSGKAEKQLPVDLAPVSTRQPCWTPACYVPSSLTPEGSAIMNSETMVTAVNICPMTLPK